MIGGYVEDRLVDFVRSQVEAASSKGVVLGLSGGLDSAVTALLAKKALGPDRVTALLLPERGVTTEEDIEDARTVADLLDLETV
ncbi:MAG: NAD(+) synthase, partial [Euryarchaeota archaeon]|nr:NAD(+) synthase [Euryarchaeota archaeon]